MELKKSHPRAPPSFLKVQENSFHQKENPPEEDNSQIPIIRSKQISRATSLQTVRAHQADPARTRRGARS